MADLLNSTPGDWETVNGRWGFSHHAETRLRVRYNLSTEDIDQLKEDLERGMFVQVPEFTPRPGSYIIEALVSGMRVFLPVGIGTKTVITAMPPFCDFPGSLMGDNLPIINEDLPDEDLPEDVPLDHAVTSADRFEQLAGNLAKDYRDVLVENASLRKELNASRKKLKDLEEQFKSIRSIMQVMA